MRNIVNEKPTDKLIGRLRFSAEFVNSNDIEGKNILDIGCGYGWFEAYCIKRKVGNIEGIEISDSDLETARKYVVNNKVNFTIAGALELPFNDNVFDTVVAWEVIEHIPKNTERKMFKEVDRVLKKNGIFYLSTPYNSFFSTFLDPAFWLIGHRHYSKEKLIGLGEKSGFKVSEIHIKGDMWSLFDLMDIYISKWILRRKQIFGKFFEKKENKAYSPSKEGLMDIFVRYEK